MCGISGVYCFDDSEIAPSIVKRGMFVLQPRGQNGAGIATISCGRIDLRKGGGKVDEVAAKADFDSMRGFCAIGHTRYPTYGNDKTDEWLEINSQPEALDKPCCIAAGHNGNVTNSRGLKREFERRGVAFKKQPAHGNDGNITEAETQCDIKYILGALSIALEGNERPGNDDLFHAAKKVMENVGGAYSVVALIGNGGDERMLAFTDPLRIRPCVIGRRGNSYMAASETTALNYAGFGYLFDMGPGEAIIFSRNSRKGVERKPLLRRGFRPCMFELVYFARPDSVIDGVPVAQARMELAACLAENEKYSFDVVVPVPDSGRTHAEGFAKALRGPGRRASVESGFSRRRHWRTFIDPDTKSRSEKVREKFVAIKYIMDGRRVLLYDDSFVRGATSRELVAMARNAGAMEVHFRATIVPRFPCFYGIDYPTLEELGATRVAAGTGRYLGHQELERAIAEYIGADSFRFNPPEVIGETIRNLAARYRNPDDYNPCIACLNGSYPTEDGYKLLEILETANPETRVYDAG